MNSSQPIDYWDKHGACFTLGLIFVPRLALLFCDYEFALVDWLLWIFFPRLLVAILGTAYYWNTNSVICIIAWLMVFEIITV